MDLTNQKFNRLLVLEKTDERDAGSIVWKCQCDCGNIVKVSARRLKSNNTKSCGCLNNDRRRERIIKYNEIKNPYYVGLQINEFKLLEALPARDASGNIVWKCECSCGNLCYVNTSNLKRQKNCGNIKNHPILISFKDITGQRFGKLLALEPTEQRQYNSIVWKCQCDCGNICYKAEGVLVAGDAQSCGCLKSKGEEAISALLRNNNISFESQKTFQDCKTDQNYHYYFDFYINNSYIIEYDGEQHFKQTGWEPLELIQKRDLAKNQYCKEHKIPLIRIPYTRLKQLCLDDLLLETSQFII